MIFGTDPEFFAGYFKDGKPYVLPPVFFREKLGVPFIPNDKHPIFLKMDDNHDAMIHEDGAAFELSISPSENWVELWDAVNKAKRYLENRILQKFTDFCDGRVHTLPTIGYEVERWKNESESFQLCNQFGCDRDWDAFDTERECKVLDASKHPERYGGGHIHISGVEAIKKEPISAIHSLALTVGLAAVAYTDTPELDRQRTFLYGKPGKYRPQSYGHLYNEIPHTDAGIEYRTPSNRWTENWELGRRIFEAAEVGIKYLLEGKLINELLPELRIPATEAILNCNQELAKELISYVNSKL